MTREEAIKAFKNCKFFAESSEKSEAAQRVLFSLGFRWKSGDVEPCNLDEACIIVEDGVIFWSHLNNWSEVEQPLVKVDDIINSYASRRARKIASKFHEGQVLYSPKTNCVLVYRGTNHEGAVLTDTYMYFEGKKMADFGGETKVGNGYTRDYQPANEEQKARLEATVADILKQVRERVQKLASIDFEEEDNKENK